MHDAGLTGLPLLLLPVLAGGAALVRERRPTAPRLLVVLAEASAVAAVVHVWVAPEHFAESALYGTFFVATGVAGIGFAMLVLARPSRGVLLAGAAGNAALVGLWLVTRLIAVPLGRGAGETEPFGALDVLASSAELIAVVAAALALGRAAAAGLPARRQGRRWPSHVNAGGISWVHVSKL